MTSDEQLKQELLTAWEETHKKGQLTLWIFLALKDGPKYVDEIRDFIHEYSGSSISCEDQSLYRALRKFNHLDMVSYDRGKGNRGPDRKYYTLTTLGRELLDEFIDRHIKVFFQPRLSHLIGIGTETS